MFFDLKNQKEAGIPEEPGKYAGPPPTAGLQCAPLDQKARQKSKKIYE
jgi:hypothetical protein